MLARRLPVIVVVALVAATVALVAAGVLIGLLSGESRSDHGGVVGAIAFGFAGSGAVIALRRPSLPIGWLFLATGVAAGLGLMAGSYADSWVTDRSGPELLGKAAAGYGASRGSGSFSSRARSCCCCSLTVARCRRAGGSSGGSPASGSSPCSRAGCRSQARSRTPLSCATHWASKPSRMCFRASAGWASSSASSARRSRSSCASGARRRSSAHSSSGWAYAGTIVAITFTVSIALYDVVGSTAANSAIMASILTLPVARGIAVLRHRLYDIDVVISRTLVYAALTAGLAAAYVAVSLALGVVVGSGSTLPTAAGTLAVALAFRPLRGWIQARVDRRFDRARYEGVRKVEHFLTELRAGRAAPEATGAVLADALQDPTLDLYLWFPETREYIDAEGRVVTDVAAGGRAVTPVRRGMLQLACLAHDPSLAARPRLLASMTSAAGLAIEIERLRVEVRRRLAEVEESRARIVTVGDEERVRLERDLHDGAQQRLVSLGLSLRNIQSRLPVDSDAARELDVTVGELADAIGELRSWCAPGRPG